MLEHKSKECLNVWRDREYDTFCPNCWCGDYTTEWAEVNPFYFRDRNDLLLAGEEQREQKADVKKKKTVAVKENG